MADYINLEDSEINSVLEKLIATHQLEVETIDDMYYQFNDLMAEGNFYAEQTCGYIYEVLDELEMYIMPCVETQFALIEQEIQSFVATVNNLDTI